MEEQIATMLDRVDVINEAIQRQQEQLKTLQARLNDEPPANLEETKAMTHDAQTLLYDIHGYENEMKRIQSEAAENERKHKEIIIKFAKVKAEYDQQKVEYEEEYKAADESAGRKAQNRAGEKQGNRPEADGTLPDYQKAFHAARGQTDQRAVRRLLHGSSFRNASQPESGLGYYRMRKLRQDDRTAIVIRRISWISFKSSKRKNF